MVLLLPSICQLTRVSWKRHFHAKNSVGPYLQGAQAIVREERLKESVDLWVWELFS